MRFKFTMAIEKVPEGYIGYIPELPGANSQGNSIDEVKDNLIEAVELVLEANRYLFNLGNSSQYIYQENLELISV